LPLSFGRRAQQAVDLGIAGGEAGRRLSTVKLQGRLAKLEAVHLAVTEPFAPGRTGPMLATFMSPSNDRPPNTPRSPLPVTIRFGASIRADLIRKRPPLTRAPSKVALGLAPSRASRPVPPPPDAVPPGLDLQLALGQPDLGRPLGALEVVAHQLQVGDVDVALDREAALLQAEDAVGLATAHLRDGDDPLQRADMGGEGDAVRAGPLLGEVGQAVAVQRQVLGG
jgi:hypothetical protein